METTKMEKLKICYLWNLNQDVKICKLRTTSIETYGNYVSVDICYLYAFVYDIFM